MRPRAAALGLYGVAEDEGNWGLLLLEDVRALLETHRVEWPEGEAVHRTISSATLVEELKARSERQLCRPLSRIGLESGRPTPLVSAPHSEGDTFA